MPAISVFKFNKNLNIEKVCKLLDKRKVRNSWFNAKPSKYCEDEVFIQYWYYEDIEETIKRILSEEDAYELILFFKKNGKDKILRRCYCFINIKTKTLEIYRGSDKKRSEILSALEKFLNIKLTPLFLSSKVLKKIYLNCSTELRKVVFKDVDGLDFEILIGKLSENKKFNEFLKKYSNNLKSITFKPKIKFLSSNTRYNVTINENGVIRFSSEGLFRWRPRYEIRQILFGIYSCNNIICAEK